ncbi:hypothetical protein UFOVP594_15 [uncultured Caudovirales phage]|uniref:Uncharacterized protein n=1 Tax=uncultured Caudovirales phage TaxID=2100421 RepID=A0A6J5MY42_9CAUD|nr:hypothetical protein UFOVP594_15 [uncultured Caudovirales phage]
MQKLTSKDTPGMTGKLVIMKFAKGTRDLLWKSEPMFNLVVSSDGYGRNLIMRQLSGNTAYPILIDSASIGDDNTAPNDADTDLGNVLVSGISISNMVVTNDELVVDVFASDATLPDDTYQEFGLKCGTQLFSHVIISPAYTKSSNEDTLFTYTLTLNG